MGRRGIAGCLLPVLLGLAGCGDQQPPDPASDQADVTIELSPWHPEDDEKTLSELELRGSAEQSPPTETPVPTPPPSVEPPELDDTQLGADLAALSAGDRTLVDHHLSAPFGEGTWIVAAPMTVAEARLRLLGPDPTPARRRDFVGADSSAYTFVQVGDGVVAWEQSSFADPPRRQLAELSRDGAASAVVTDNVEAMTRFGYARDGQVVFDAFEYAFVDSIDEIPAEVRDLARLAWVDPDGPLVETASWTAVGMAMAEKVTGVRADPVAQQVTEETSWYAVPLPWAAAEDG